MSERDFEAGYMCAVATLVKAHNETTMARDLIDAYGRPDWRNVAAYDRLILGNAGLMDDPALQQPVEAAEG